VLKLKRNLKLIPWFFIGFKFYKRLSFFPQKCSSAVMGAPGRRCLVALKPICGDCSPANF
jgi:hypothetical protein